MTKCKFCGESNPDGSRFCAHCGQALVQDDNAAVAAALEAAQAEFDKDSLVTLDKSRITYVCTVCGSINRIDQDKCTRCGKPRPRSEYVGALKRIKQSEQAKEEAATLTAPLPVAVPEVQKPEPVQEEAPAVQQPVQVAQQEPPQQVVQQVIAQPQQVQVVSAYGGQSNAIAQPFVVVPYVNPMQPLWQYHPNQLYRYQAYTQEEIEAIKARREMEELNARMALIAQEKAREAQLAKERERMEELAKAAEAEAQSRAQAAAGEKKEVKKGKMVKGPRSAGVSIVGALMFLMAVALIVVSVFLEAYQGNKGYYYAFGIVAVIRQIPLDFLHFEQPAIVEYQFDGILSIIAPIGAAVMALCAVIIVIRSFVRVCTGHARHRGFFIPMVLLLGYVATIVGIAICGIEGEITLNSVLGALLAIFQSELPLGFWVILGLVVGMFILGFCSPKTYHKVKKAKKQ